MQNDTDKYSHLKTRPQNFLKNGFFNLCEVQEKEFRTFNNFLFSSPCDLGVTLNGGRRGSKYGPQSIVNILGKFQTYREDFKVLYAPLLQHDDDDSFEEKQIKQIRLIEKILLNSSWEKIVHIGGGHDQIYPLLMSLTKSLKNNSRLFCLNIDAHLDTRTDNQAHSGTPFRQWINQILENQKSKVSQIQLHQFGIHKQANHPDNYELDHMKVHEFSIHEVEKNVNELQLAIKSFKLTSEDLLVLSLDCDVFDAAEFPQSVLPMGWDYLFVSFGEF